MYKILTAIPVLTLPAYVATDCVGAVLTFNHAANTNSLRVRRVQIIDNDLQDEEYNLHLFSINPSATADELARILLHL